MKIATMNRILIPLFSLLLSGGVLGAEAYESPLRAGALEGLVVQDQGRLKPLDTFARSQLLLYHAKTTIDRQKAIDWLLELMVTPQASYQRKVFTVREKEAILGLGIGLDPESRYSFVELSEAIRERQESLNKLVEKGEEERTRAERQLAMLYLKTMRYLALSRSLTGLMPDIRVNNAELAEAIGFEVGKGYTYRQFLDVRRAVSSELEMLRGRREGDAISPKESALIDLIQQLNVKLADQSSKVLKLVMPEGEQEEAVWFAPWELLDGRELTTWQTTRLQELEAIVAAFIANGLAEVSEEVVPLVDAVHADVKLKAELIYNKANFFKNSIAFYILAFLLLLVSYVFSSKWVGRISYGSLIIGFLLHLTGLLFRVYIMGRPPVSTLYESILFVGWVLVLFSVILEAVRHDTLGIIVGSVAGTALHFIGFSYAAEGDTLGMLVAVLNSNFWLGTHVLTITIGYGVALTAGLVAHVYLLLRLFFPGQPRWAKEAFKVSYGICLVAVFFTTFGTILGGIWGDQSWGRFWGWDPKENGALLIVIWLLIVIHGRLAGRLKELSFSVALALTPISVALAWFGVNLLQVGLHSYGFDDGVATNLYYFCLGEAVFAIGCGVTIQLRSRMFKTVPSS